MCILINNQTAMFTATKLRRGMIPKDKERGMLNLESWGKPCVTTTLVILLWVGTVNLLAGRSLPCPFPLTLSPRRVCWPVHYPDGGCSVPSCEGVKKSIFRLLGVPPQSLMQLIVCEYLYPIHVESWSLPIIVRLLWFSSSIPSLCVVFFSFRQRIDLPHAFLDWAFVPTFIVETWAEDYYSIVGSWP